MSHSCCASSTILGDLFSDFPPLPLAHISGDMSFGANGGKSSENLSRLLEEFTAGMALYESSLYIFERRSVYSGKRCSCIIHDGLDSRLDFFRNCNPLPLPVPLPLPIFFIKGAFGFIPKRSLKF